MRISTRGEYGLRTLMELGMEPESALSLRDIAARQRISLDYLEQIVPSLKNAGLIKARRGAHGGYQLARPSEEITVFEALTALEGSLDPMACLSTQLQAGEGPSCLASGSCAVQEVWSEMRDAMETVLKNKTLADMIARQNQNFKVPIRTYSQREIARLVVLN